LSFISKYEKKVKKDRCGRLRVVLPNNMI
jgi:hypothetical protein